MSMFTKCIQMRSIHLCDQDDYSLCSSSRCISLAYIYYRLGWSELSKYPRCCCHFPCCYVLIIYTPAELGQCVGTKVVETWKCCSLWLRWRPHMPENGGVHKRNECPRPGRWNRKFCNLQSHFMCKWTNVLIILMTYGELKSCKVSHTQGLTQIPVYLFGFACLLYSYLLNQNKSRMTP